MSAAGHRLGQSMDRLPNKAACLCGESKVRPAPIGVRCEGCGLLARSEMPTADRLASWYERAYWQHDAAMQLGGGRDRVQAHALRAISLNRRPGTLVDVGCGAGTLLALARERGWSGIGFEPSAQAAAHARRRGLEVHETPWPPSTLDDGGADAVTFINSLDHLVDPTAALSEARRVLRPGGVLYVRVPNAPVHIRLLAVLRPLGLGGLPVFHLYGFGRRALRHHLRREGFQVVAVRTAPASSAIVGEGHRAVRLAARALQWLLASPGVDRLALGTSIEAVAVKTPPTGRLGRGTARAVEACAEVRRR